jgi:hypothetical protein
MLLVILVLLEYLEVILLRLCACLQVYLIKVEIRCEGNWVFASY